MSSNSEGSVVGRCEGKGCGGLVGVKEVGEGTGSPVGCGAGSNVGRSEGFVVGFPVGS
jgi:hypothetical protein